MASTFPFLILTLKLFSPCFSSISASINRLISRSHLTQPSAIVESEEVKKKLFVQLDEIAKNSAILASNKRSISVSRFAYCTNRPPQVIGMHFMNPPSVMKWTEIVRGADNSDLTFDSTQALSHNMQRSLHAEEIPPDEVSPVDSPSFTHDDVMRDLSGRVLIGTILTDKKLSWLGLLPMWWTRRGGCGLRLLRKQ